MLNITKNIDTFIKEPFNPKMDLLQWIAFTVIIVTAGLAWILILKSMKENI